MTPKALRPACAVLAVCLAQAPPNTAQEPKPANSTEQKTQQWREPPKGKALKECIAKIEIVDEDQVTRPYKIIDIVHVEARTVFGDALKRLKKQACKSGASAMMDVEIGRGEHRDVSAASAKLIVWVDQEDDDTPAGEKS